METTKEQILRIVNSTEVNINHRELLLDLLAVIHRDGGQHTEDVGVIQSVKDGMSIVSYLVVK